MAYPPQTVGMIVCLGRHAQGIAKLTCNSAMGCCTKQAYDLAFCRSGPRRDICAAQGVGFSKKTVDFDRSSGMVCGFGIHFQVFHFWASLPVTLICACLCKGANHSRYAYFAWLVRWKSVVKPPHSCPSIGRFNGQPVYTPEVVSVASQEKLDAPDATLSAKAHGPCPPNRGPCPVFYAKTSTRNFHRFCQYLKVTARRYRYKL